MREVMKCRLLVKQLGKVCLSDFQVRGVYVGKKNEETPRKGDG
jgi:hypothetical protein